MWSCRQGEGEDTDVIDGVVLGMDGVYGGVVLKRGKKKKRVVKMVRRKKLNEGEEVDNQDA